MTPMSTQAKYKLVFLGDQPVGKTSILGSLHWDME